MSNRFPWLQAVFAAVAAAIILALVILLIPSGRLHPIACFTTSLAERTPQQLQNIRIAVNALDGRALPSRARFSFNAAAGPFTAARGYADAPAIIRGRRQPAPAGGVCQVSSTLYNAALLSGIGIVARHPHAAPVSSVPPGRDAMVAAGRSDLVLLNDTPGLLRLRARISGPRLIICISGRAAPKTLVSVSTQRRSLGPGRFEVTTWRTITTARAGGRKQRTQMISRDRYEPPLAE